MREHGLLTQKELNALMTAFENHGISVKEQKYSTPEAVPLPPPKSDLGKQCAARVAGGWEQELTGLFGRPMRIRLRSIRRFRTGRQVSGRYCYSIAVASGTLLYMFCTEPFINLVNETALGARPGKPPVRHALTPIDTALFEQTGFAMTSVIATLLKVPQNDVIFKTEHERSDFQDMAEMQFDVEVPSILRTSIVLLTNVNNVKQLCHAEPV